MNKRKGLIGLLLIMGILLFSCGDEESTITVDIDGIVSVTKNLSAGIASETSMSMSEPPSGISPQSLTEGERVSFTPSSMRTTLRGMYLCPEIILSNGERMCDETQTIHTVSEPQLIPRSVFLIESYYLIPSSSMIIPGPSVMPVYNIATPRQRDNPN